MPNYYTQKPKKTYSSSAPVESPEYDYERYRPDMLRKTAERYTDESGNLDQEGFEKSVMKNMYRAGDMKGVQEFTKMQKENYALDRAGRKDEADTGYKKAQTAETEEGRRYKRGQVADQRMQYFGPLAQKTIDIYNSQGPEAANTYHRNVQKVAMDMGMIGENEYEDVFNPETAQVVADYYGKTVEKKKTTSRAGQFTEKQVAEMRRHNEEVQTAKDQYDSLKAQGWSDFKINTKHPNLLKTKDKALYSEVESPKKAAPKPQKIKVSKDKVKFLD